MVSEALTHELGARLINLTPVPTYPDTVVYEAETTAASVVFKATELGGRDPDGIGLEAWACQTAVSHGVAAPRVLAVDLTCSRFPTSFFIMERAAGAPLSNLPAGHDVQTPLLIALGDQLRRLHAIEVGGFGWLDERRYRQAGHVRGTEDMWTHAILRDIPEALSYLGGVGAITPEQAALASQHVADGVGEFSAPESPRLLHGDLGTSHVWVDASAGAITSIVDWGERAAGDPAWDFLELDPAEVPVVLEGYGPEAAMRERLEASYDLYRLARAIPWAAKWHRRGEAQVVAWLTQLLDDA